jgi:hypothetical protein
MFKLKIITKMSDEMRKCSKCLLNLPITNFGKWRTGEYKKMCNYCLNRVREYYHTKKCLHDKFLYHCEICRNIQKQSKENKCPIKTE